MPVVLLVAAAVLLVWSVIVFRWLSPVGVAVATVAVGYVFGHDFWNLHLGPLPLTIDRLLLVNNSSDPVLKRYAFMCPLTCPAALGFCGLPNLRAFGAEAARIRQFDGGPELGSTHGYRDHLEAPTVVAMTRPYVLWQDIDAPCEPTAPLEVISARTE